MHQRDDGSSVDQCAACGRCIVEFSEDKLDCFFGDEGEDGSFRLYFICKACNTRIMANGFRWGNCYYHRLFGTTNRRGLLYYYTRCVPNLFGPNSADLDGAEIIAVRWPDEDAGDVADDRGRRFLRSFCYPPPWMRGEYRRPPPWMGGEDDPPRTDPPEP